MPPGEDVAMLMNLEPMDFGTQEAEFNAQHLPSGMYFCRITLEGLNVDESPATPYTDVKRMLLVK